MSSWTYVSGIIRVSPLGKTQEEMRYVLETVLNHLPIVSGSEDEMKVYIVQPDGYNMSCSCDEFGFATNNLIDRYGCKSRDYGWLHIQSDYILVLDGKLRDRFFNDTYKELQKFMCRLAKRVIVAQVMVEISDYYNREIITNARPYYKMFETPSWADENSYNWCEHLLRKEVPKCYTRGG